MYYKSSMASFILIIIDRLYDLESATVVLNNYKGFQYYNNIYLYCLDNNNNQFVPGDGSGK